MRSLINDVIEAPANSTIGGNVKDYKVDIDVRWCSGCGGYSILAQSQRVMASLGIPREKFVFISGIGCSSRFPYYINVYGMHTMHGRALPIASGLQVERPDLSILVASGDCDSLSIGGNHFIHTARRNVDLNVLMFNYAIYGMTKGQYSPTSLKGQLTKSSPLGVLDDPFNPAALAIGAGASFVARCYDRDPQMMHKIFERAAKHVGYAFVEVYSYCVIFNDGAFDLFTKKETRKEHTVELQHGKPLVFGNNDDKGVKLDGVTPVVVSLNDGSHSIDDLLVYNENDTSLAFIMANMTYNSNLPRPMGVFQVLSRQSYNQRVVEQLKYFESLPGANDLDKLLLGEDSWEIE